MIKFHVINDTDSQEFSKKLEEFCYNKVITNIKYSTNSIQVIEIVPIYFEVIKLGEEYKEVVKTNYSALIQYQ